MRRVIGNSIFLDDLTKPFRQFELIKAVGDDMTSAYDDKVAQEHRHDHDHINGLYRGCAHQDCNINLNHKNFKLPVYFHNLKGFDGHLVIQGLHNRNFQNIRIIAQNFEKYMSISFANFLILDSFAFASL